MSLPEYADVVAAAPLLQARHQGRHECQMIWRAILEAGFPFLYSVTSCISPRLDQPCTAQLKNPRPLRALHPVPTR